MAPNYIRLHRLSKSHFEKHKKSRNPWHISLRSLKRVRKTMFTTQTTTFSPSTHHNKTMHFPTTPLKNAAKPQTGHSESIDDFFLKQAPDSSAWTADRDV
jgi:hypothetical protein